jgi:hypothetical protein
VPPRSPKKVAASVAQLLRDPELAARMAAAGRVRAEEFSWPRVTAKVDDYYGFVIRRLAATGTLPAHFHAPIPRSPRALGQAAPTGLDDAPEPIAGQAR